jgi:hypothetical protein
MPEPCLKLLRDDELTAILAAAILDGRAGCMSRDAEGYLAGVCAKYLADRLALAGVAAVRNTRRTGGDEGGVAAAAFSTACRDVWVAGMRDMDEYRSPQEG